MIFNIQFFIIKTVLYIKVSISINKIKYKILSSEKNTPKLN